jgi:acetylornithine deacetylase/succinyl-diaminopimelate desuccinylase-like protein
LLTIPEASSRPGFWLGLTRLEAEVPRIVAQAVQLAEIPSPTGAEEARAEAVRDLFAEALGMARIDQAGNVAAVLAGAPGRPGTVILAPLDSWYESIEPPHIQVRPDRLTGPGIAGQSIALAVQVALARTLRERPVQGLGDIWFIATVGSEMSGDLRGICHLFPWLPTVADRVICLQGPGLGRLDHWSVGTYRGELGVWAPGGHCWRDVGRPNALRLAMEFSRKMESAPKPGLPRTLYNPAQLQSGDAWNTLPSKAVLRFELRSDGEDELQRLIREAQSAAADLCKGLSGCRAELSQKGFRHATGLFLDHPLVIGTREAQSWAGLVPRLGASSSDASVCLHYGVASVTIGLASVVGLETHMESLYMDSLPLGLRQAYAVLVQVAGRNAS